MKWKALAALLGLSAINATTDVKDEHLDKVDETVAGNAQLRADLDTANARIKELEGASATSDTRIKELEGQLATANATLATTQDALGKANAEVERLGKLDAGSFSNPKSEGDKFSDDKVDAAEMPFQKDLLSRV